MGDNWDSGTGSAWDAAKGNETTFESGDARNYADEVGNNNAASEGCRNCGQDGHFARECPEPRKMTCFNCGEDGHAKADCTNPRKFTGTCNICNEEGHPASQCPSKPKICKRCRMDNDHDTKDCKSNFYLDLEDVPDVSEDTAWSRIVDSSVQNDIDDFKDGLKMLQKANPNITYPVIEKKLRAQSLRFYLIATKKEVSEGYTLVNLQGEPEKNYCVGIFKSAGCLRPMMAESWPKSPEENIERLADAGMAKELGIPYCRTCSAFGHSTRNCTEEKPEPAGQPEVRCALCDEVGHRVRDCTQPRQKPREPRACKICESTEHLAKDCTEKPVMTCRNCQGEGHKAADCTEPKVIKCNNPDCGQIGHSMKACPIPIAYEKMVCRHCGEKGHMSASRCAPGAGKKEEDNQDDENKAEEVSDTGNANGFGSDTFDNAPAANGGWDNGDTDNNASSGAGWSSGGNAQPVDVNVGW